MAVNKAFHTSNFHSIATERSLYQNLIKEAVQIYGHDVYYINRDTVALDNVLGEESLSKFTKQTPIEMYIEDAEGFGGDKEIITQFGLENRNEITFVVSKERFQEMDSQIVIESGTDTTGGGILLETGSIDQSENSSELTSIQGDNNFYVLQDTASTDADRPQEGDLVYHPVLARMFEINFVDHDEPFYQLDNNPVYKIRCKQFEYSSEEIDTGITTIDEIEGTESLDTLQYQFTLQQSTTYNENIQLEFATQFSTELLLEETDGDNIIGEDDTTSAGENILLENAADSGDASYLIQEDYIVGDQSTDTTNQNELFDTLDDTVLDFSETNPFGDAGSK
tara:strand:+ start:2973 stop:3986 length:1014 start_codon:yes stop_codon:yes gene_type:complete